MKLHLTAIYGTSLAIWDHTPPDIPRLYPSQRPVLDLSTPEGWKAELTYVLISDSSAISQVSAEAGLQTAKSV